MSLRVVLLILSFASIAHAVPENARHLGEAMYQQMRLRQLGNPTLLWMDDEVALRGGVIQKKDSRAERTEKVLSEVAFANPVAKEINPSYTRRYVNADVDGYGGPGTDGNLGSGRAAIVRGKWQIKGSGPTMMVNRRSDRHHKSGAAILREGIWEGAWSQVLAHEMPYGAVETLAVISSNSLASLHGYYHDPRVLIVREDVVRPAHFMINPTGIEIQPEIEQRRVQGAMQTIVSALPKPAGYVSRGRQDDFIVGLNEFVDRQAIQHGYAWAHSLFHGGTSPSNASLDGRMLDLGSYAAFDGYPKARVMKADFYFGDVWVYQKFIIRVFIESLQKTLPADLLAVLPASDVLEQRFAAKFEATRAREMLRLAGSIDEFVDKLADSKEGQRLSTLLLKMAEAGNSKPIEVWEGQSPMGRGLYQMPALFKALAAGESIDALVRNVRVRESLKKAYAAYFAMHGELARANGVSREAEAHYREVAVEVRNKKMTTMFRTPENEAKVTKAIQAFEAGNKRAVGRLMNEMISGARREHREAAPFTVIGLDGVRVNARQPVQRVVRSCESLFN